MTRERIAISPEYPLTLQTLCPVVSPSTSSKSVASRQVVQTVAEVHAEQYLPQAKHDLLSVALVNPVIQVPQVSAVAQV